MLLILSEQNDEVTNRIIEWLDFYKKEWARVNYEDDVRLSYFSLTANGIEFELLVNHETTLHSKEIDRFWYRRGEINFDLKIGEDAHYDAGIREWLFRENTTIVDCIYHHLDSLKSINKPSDNDINKLIVLVEAQKVGFKIPDSWVVDRKEKLPYRPSYISKGLSFTGFRASDGQFYSAGTISGEGGQDEFSYSLFQEEIKKWVEVRTFHLDGENHSVSIFSQNNQQTKLDFRNYDRERPNRVIPFTLPHEIECKLNELMKVLSLDSGSIDLIVDQNGDYYFLEVNPIGQFLQVSNPGGYYLEEKIAKKLMA
ncbi:MAG TPA: grasp-with-spasm system ATP-grasp peptide maturase [Cytophagales bacterium]|nr:grasp-with-spasm system ATP-grasp peptide maturase [Cytophagales bacterium]HAP60525.1 grasp-with-spasm system ATP-grasp peptide maturase [Cytophagales bacterium]